MSSPLAFYATVMAFIFSSFCSMCGTAVSLGTRRMATKRRTYNQVFSAAFLCSGSSSTRNLGKSVIATRSSPACRQQGLHRAATTNSLTPWVDRPCRQARASAKCNNLFCSSSVSTAHSGPAPQTPAPQLSSPQQQKAKASPVSVAVLAAQGHIKEDLERCRSLAEKLGVALVVPRQEQGLEEKEEHQGERGKGGGLAGGAAEAERDGFKFTMLFDEAGRLALGQPGSCFNPLVVRR